MEPLSSVVQRLGEFLEELRLDPPEKECPDLHSRDCNEGRTRISDSGIKRILLGKTHQKLCDIYITRLEDGTYTVPELLASMIGSSGWIYHVKGWTDDDRMIARAAMMEHGLSFSESSVLTFRRTTRIGSGWKSSISAILQVMHILANENRDSYGGENGTEVVYGITAFIYDKQRKPQ